MEQYTREEGHARPSQKYKTEDGYRLGTWVDKQRAKKSAMPQERKTRLEALPGWKWDPWADNWEEGFRLLEGYAREVRHARPPGSYKTGDEYRLGTWVIKQRQSKIEMPQERRTRLEALPGWSWDARADKWDEGFRHLEEYAKKMGHARPPDDYKTGDEYPLGSWVGTQRATKSKMPQDRRERLEALLGWVWKVNKV